jgi:hypothetical protein
VEEKMGIHGSATCSMALGGKGRCRGLLLGEENKGMRAMFYMMNAARLAVGFIGFACGSAAYLYALNYARERLQGKDLASIQDPDAPQVPIIRHPDVRRMLLGMKAHVEGMRSLIYYINSLIDRHACSADRQEQDACQGLLDLLTPVVKSYCSDRGFDICTEAMQVYGGYGYTCGYPVEQLLRDCKIASIYEGTNGIQAMDLLGRKLGMKGGLVFMNFLSEIQKTTGRAKKIRALKDYAARLDEAVNRLGEVAMHLGQTALSAEVKVAFAFAKPFLDVIGDVCLAWMLLWRAAAAAPQLEKLAGSLDPGARSAAAAKNKEAAFYEGVLQSARYLINTVLPVTMGKMNAIKASDAATIEIPEAAFGG